MDGSPRDADGAVITKCVAIDAIPYGDGRVQWYESNIRRDLVKAYSGFTAPGTQTGISTGNWGCGAFGGDLHLKSLLQWVACSAAGRRMQYYTFHEGDPNLIPQFNALAAEAVEKECTVGQLDRAIFTAAAEFLAAGPQVHFSPTWGFLHDAVRRELFNAPDPEPDDVDGGGGGGGGGADAVVGAGAGAGAVTIHTSDART